jgi:hypothetical protein
LLGRTADEKTQSRNLLFLLGSAIKQVSRLRVFVRSRSPLRPARNDNELKLTMANRVKNGDLPPGK